MSILDKDEKTLFERIKDYPDETLLSWAGYTSVKQFEDDTDDVFSKVALVKYNYEDLLVNLKELG